MTAAVSDQDDTVSGELQLLVTKYMYISACVILRRDDAA